ncbi:ATP-binding protein [Nitrospirillum viridazoti]|uniref:histidine kinase n=1 Tax=Nitrospirillum viridazoti CBAmc TaxID=1441467 RepID=A0A248JMX5_9PROT|nr:ATP-binding protein [Nitrospirillum amazonense]ASG19594.1 PAS domain-containing sensor histidine kinase [Nitrospirillum amazonense CBAmc]TWB27406.1 two-component system phosphate regulon sensor histidine kinase PhoR [Nitrospirillum amazonense]
MSRLETRPDRFVAIAVLMLAPTAALLGALVIAGRLNILLALAAFALVAAVTAVARHLVLRDSRLIAAYLDQVRDRRTPLPPPQARTLTGAALLEDIAQLHQNWLRHREEIEHRLAADEAVVEALHDPLMLVDDKRKVGRANSAARALFGDRMLNRDLAVSVRNPDVLAAVDAVLAGGDSRRVEFTLPLPVERVLEVRVTPFRPAAEDGAPQHEITAIVTLHDITAIKRSEQMRADFVANASHELRTPLSTLVGFIETLRGPARDDADARDRFLAIMQEQAGRMSRLVMDLLSLSRIELDEHTHPTGETNVAQLVQSVVAMLELKAAARKITIRVQGGEDLPRVQGDEDQLTQVFQNLIDNAIKYGREQTDVVVSLERAEAPPAPGATGIRARQAPQKVAGIKVSVTDKGEGIARTHLPRLTERFYRVDAARSRALGGTGLGLAIVKHIVNRHRGRLTIDSEVGKGSTFTVHLPGVEKAAEKPEKPVPQSAPNLSQEGGRGAA